MSRIKCIKNAIFMYLFMNVCYNCIIDMKEVLKMDENKLRIYIGSKIKQLRRQRNITQNELGKLLGVKNNTISAYERGAISTDQDTLYRLADIFGVSINDFFPNNNESKKLSSEYKYFPAYVSAGLPNDIEPVTEYETISISDEVMGKYAKSKDIYFIKVNGESMNKIIPHNSLVAVRPVSSIHDLKTDDIVVYRKDSEYAIKRLVIDKDKWIFKPESTDDTFYDDVVYKDDDVTIKGKVVLYIVEVE